MPAGSKRKVIVGTRGSKLALCQTNWVVDQLRRFHPDVEFELKEISTTGDRFQDKPLSEIGGQGLFVKEVEAALLSGQIDLAVHSLKDVPAKQPHGLSISCVPSRQEPSDVMVSEKYSGLNDLPEGARIGTSSLRRIAQLRAFRRDLEFVPLRGNLDTRLRKLSELGLDAVILAAAGLLRLGLGDRITELISTEICVPAAGQGALGIETRTDDHRIIDLISVIDDREVRCCTEAERKFIETLGGGCHAPVGGFAFSESGRITLLGVVSDLKGENLIRGTESGSLDEAAGIGKRLGEKLLARGGERILLEIESAGQLKDDGPKGSSGLSGGTVRKGGQ